jgi:carbon-monoxide dehydrogenase medium subunit
MKPAPFAYADPRSVDEVVDHLARHGDDAKVLAGGQSLVPMLNFRLARPSFVVDVNRVAALDTIAEDGDRLRVGALVRQRALEVWAGARAPLVAAALRLIGHTAIRQRGTVAGSVVHADPAAELPALLVCLDGTVVARSAGGEREIPASDLFVGPLMTSLRADEVVTETRWTLPPPTAGWGLHEMARRHGDFALVGVAAVVSIARGVIARARIALFGAGPVPVRAEAAERVLVGQTSSPALVEAAARAVVDGLDPMSDLHAPASYRVSVARTLTARALTDALGRAKDVTR